MAQPYKARAVNWCFTLNNPSSLLDFAAFTPEVEYAVYQKENAPTTGTPHYQGFVRFKARITRSALARLIPGAHLEIARGTIEENKTYCTKEESRSEGPWEYGTIPQLHKGKRTDWHAIKDMAQNGQTDREIADVFPGHYARNFAGIQKLKALYVAERTEMPMVHVICGPPGTGKSHYARAQFPAAYWKAPNNKWWDQYDSEEDVVLDEFKGWFPYNDLNRLCDKYEYRVEIKGASVPCPARNVVLISNWHPFDWYDLHRIQFASFKRRVGKWSIYSSLETHEDFDSFEAFDQRWRELGYNVGSSTESPAFFVSGN